MIQAFVKVGDRVIWRHTALSPEFAPIHQGTVMATANKGAWLEVHEDWCWGNEWLFVNDLNVCEIIDA